MAIEHRNIPDEDLHEVKGAASAVSGQIPVADGAGSAPFRVLSYNQLSDRPSSTGYTLELAGRQYTDQIPSASGTAQQILYGSGETSDDVTLSNTGSITFNTAGEYFLLFVHRVGRTASSGTANFFIRYLLDGDPFGAPVVWSMEDSGMTSSYSIQIPLQASAGQVMTTEMLRDSSGSNYGGLYTVSPNASGWEAAPSATVVVYKYRGLS